MNILPLVSILILTGCATPTNELMRNAKQCVAEYADENGVITDAPQEFRTECWAEANKRIELIEKREKQREIDSQCCLDRRGKPVPGCQCVTADELRRILWGKVW